MSDHKKCNELLRANEVLRNLVNEAVKNLAKSRQFSIKNIAALFGVTESRARELCRGAEVDPDREV